MRIPVSDKKNSNRRSRSGQPAHDGRELVCANGLGMGEGSVALDHNPDPAHVPGDEPQLESLSQQALASGATIRRIVFGARLRDPRCSTNLRTSSGSICPSGMFPNQGTQNRVMESMYEARVESASPFAVLRPPKS